MQKYFSQKEGSGRDFPGGLMVKNLPCNAGNTDSIPDLGRSRMPLSNSAHEEQLLSPGTREPVDHNQHVHHNKRCRTMHLKLNSAKK